MEIVRMIISMAIGFVIGVCATVVMIVVIEDTIQKKKSDEL